MPTCLRRLALAGSLWIAAVAWAQAPQDPLAALRSKNDLSDDDRSQLRAAVTQWVGEIAGSDATSARTATASLRAGFSGSAAFKQAYAAVCVEAVRSAYKKADLDGAVRLLSVLGKFETADAQPLFVEALQDDRVGVRAAGAIGLRGLRATLARSADALNAAIAALKTAGLKERARDTLRSIYAALDYGAISNPPDLKPAATAVLEVLESRARLYTGKGEVPAVGADDAGLEVAGRLLRSMSDDERKRLTAATATMMRFAIAEYCSPAKKLWELRDATSSRTLLDYRNSIERLVLAGERLLASLLNPKQSPSVLDAMRKLDRAGMKLEWKKWVPLLQAAAGQDFTLSDAPDEESGDGPGGG